MADTREGTAALVDKQDGGKTTTADLARAGTAQREMEQEPLFSKDQIDRFRNRWNDVQTSFVDDPRHAVEQADNLVADLMKQLAESFANQRSNLENQWSRGDNVSTEDLRVALKRYRSFFGRLLSL